MSISRRKCSIRGELIVKINDTTDYWWVKHMFRTKVLISDSSNEWKYTKKEYIYILQSMSLANLSVDIQCRYHAKANLVISRKSKLEI